MLYRPSTFTRMLGFAMLCAGTMTGVGCARVGRPIPSLEKLAFEVGRTTRNDVLQRLGTPQETRMPQAGRGQLLMYIYGRATGGAIAMQSLVLEFKGELLQAHYYMSSAAPVAVVELLKRLDALPPEARRLTAIERTLGNAAARGLCPASLVHCSEGSHESLMWEDGVLHFAQDAAAGNRLDVFFDARGSFVQCRLVWRHATRPPLNPCTSK